MGGALVLIVRPVLYTPCYNRACRASAIPQLRPPRFHDGIVTEGTEVTLGLFSPHHLLGLASCRYTQWMEEARVVAEYMLTVVGLLQVDLHWRFLLVRCFVFMGNSR